MAVSYPRLLMAWLPLAAPSGPLRPSDFLDVYMAGSAPRRKLSGTVTALPIGFMESCGDCLGRVGVGMFGPAYPPCGRLQPAASNPIGGTCLMGIQRTVVACVQSSGPLVVWVGGVVYHPLDENQRWTLDALGCLSCGDGGRPWQGPSGVGSCLSVCPVSLSTLPITSYRAQGITLLVPTDCNNWNRSRSLESLITLPI